MFSRKSNAPTRACNDAHHLLTRVLLKRVKVLAVREGRKEEGTARKDGKDHGCCTWITSVGTRDSDEGKY